MSQIQYIYNKARVFENGPFNKTELHFSFRNSKLSAIRTANAKTSMHVCRAFRIKRELCYLLLDQIFSFIFWPKDFHVNRNEKKKITVNQTLFVMFKCFSLGRKLPKLMSGDRNSFKSFLEEHQYPILLETYKILELVAYFYQNFNLESTLKSRHLSPNFFKFDNLDLDDMNNRKICFCDECKNSLQDLCKKATIKKTPNFEELKELMSWFDYLGNSKMTPNLSKFKIIVSDLLNTRPAGAVKEGCRERCVLLLNI